MNCVKCGWEIPEDQVFCEICLAEMERYPVKPGTAIHIPTRSPEEEVVKKHSKRKHVPTAEELLLKTRKKLRRNRIAVVVLLLVCGVLSIVVGQMVLELDFQRLVGQNYKFAGLRPGGNKETSFTIIATEATELATEEEPVAYIVEETKGETWAEEPQVTPPAEAPVEPAPEVPTEAPTEPATEAPTEVPSDVTEPEVPATESDATEAPAESVPAEERVESSSEEVAEESAA